MSSTKNKMFCVCSQNICVRMLMSGKTVLRILRCKYGNLHVASGCRKLFTSIFISFSAMFDAELCAMHDELHTAGWVELYFLNFFLIFQKKSKKICKKGKDSMIHWKSAYTEMLKRKLKMSGGKWIEGKKQFLKSHVQKEEWIGKENLTFFFFFLFSSVDHSLGISECSRWFFIFTY